MANLPLISVIMNCHNGERYLKDSIKSLINQSYKKWELIFWNNCSNDNSKLICKNFKDKRIKYFENSKLISLYKARNLAIKKSKGKYICFLDTDDWWTNNKLIKQVDFFKKNKKVKFLYTNYFQFDQKNNTKKIFFKKQLPSGKITQNLLDHYCIGILTVMIKKEIFDNFKFNNKLNIIGDYDLFIRLSLKYELKCIQLPLAYYRVHSLNYSSLKLSEYNFEISEWLNKNERNFKKKYSLFNLRKIYFKNKIKMILNIFNFFNK